MNKQLVRQLVVIAAFALTLVFNGMATTGALGGRPTAEISNSYAVYFVPANLTFSIWSVIYLGLAAFVVYQALPAQRNNPYASKIGWLFVLNSAANAGWLALFQTEQFLASVPVMLVLLGLLIAIYLRLDVGKPGVSRAVQWTMQIPFSIYLGWITVATIANIAQSLYAAGYESLFGIDGAAWAAIMLAAGTLIASLVIYRGRGNAAYALTILWAFVGIVIKQSDTALVWGTAAAMSAVILTVLVLSLWQHWNPGQPARLGRAARA